MLDNDIQYTFEDKSLFLSKVKSYWYRRGITNFNLKSKQSASISNDVSYTFVEDINMVFSKIQFCNKKNSIDNYEVNEIDKLKQLITAKEVGLSIPKTLITENNNELINFMKICKNRVITKALNTHRISFLLSKNIKCILNLKTEVVLKRKLKYDVNLEGIPSLYQEYVDKIFELRIFFLRGTFYAMAVFSQSNTKTKIDYRNYDREVPNRIVPYILPVLIKKKLIRFMKVLDIVSGSIDMIYTTKGEYVFLEVNPIGQYHWLEKNCNYSISKDIASLLCKSV
jgi:glutathione synthase/RimK-type ligase-like ATP-grasp enzyme